MKTIVALWTTANRGKSETARSFARQLTAIYSAYTPITPVPFAIPPSGDFRAVFEIYPGKTVAVESQGDPNTDLETRLDDLITAYDPYVIMCATRTRGDTVNAVERIAAAHGYQIIWTSPYDIPNAAQHPLANALKAQHIISLIQTLAII